MMAHETSRRPILELTHNGDPYGSGFTASELTEHGWIYRGDIGAMPRWWWRQYACRNGYTLCEYRADRVHEIDWLDTPRGRAALDALITDIDDGMVIR